ncbi:MAG: hypothetical protein U5J78_00710 [Parasphingorhabdus sp.]|nr:hypothetical protein [Parasphingorhabdus sp.]
MKMKPTFALAMALAATGLMATAAIPDAAYAQKKKSKGNEKASSRKLSKEFAAVAGPVQKAFEADPATAKPLAEAMLAQPWTNDDAYVAGQLAVQVGGATKDAALQRKGIEQMLNSGVATAEEAPQLNFFLGNFAYGDGQYDVAVQRLKAAVDAGYAKNDVGALLAETYFKQKNYDPGFAALKAAMAQKKAAGEVVPQDWYKRGASIALQTKASGPTAEWTYMLVDAYPSSENWRAAISVYRDTVKLDNQQNLELMRLMRKAGALQSERDYSEYADAADPRRLPGEVVAVLEEGTSKGIVRSTNAYTSETLNMARNNVKADRATLAASERDAAKAATGKIALATADAYLAYGENAKAVELYQMALTKGGVEADRAKMGLGIAQAGMNDLAAAKASFADVTGVRSGIAKFWTLWIDQKTAPAATASAGAI